MQKHIVVKISEELSNRKEGIDERVKVFIQGRY